MSTTNKPKGLPKGIKLPKHPNGFGGWEILGWGGLNAESVDAPWMILFKDDPKRGWLDMPEGGNAIGASDCFYIRAVRSPAKKPAKPSRVKRVKAKGNGWVPIKSSRLPKTGVIIAASWRGDEWSMSSPSSGGGYPTFADDDRTHYFRIPIPARKASK